MWMSEKKPIVAPPIIPSLWDATTLPLGHGSPWSPSLLLHTLSQCPLLPNQTQTVPCFTLAGGYLAHSLAIMTDAAHLLADVGSMIGSLFSLWLSTRPATRTMTFGWHRSGKAPHGPLSLSSHQKVPPRSRAGLR